MWDPIHENKQMLSQRKIIVSFFSFEGKILYFLGKSWCLKILLSPNLPLLTFVNYKFDLWIFIRRAALLRVAVVEVWSKFSICSRSAHYSAFRNKLPLCEITRLINLRWAVASDALSIFFNSRCLIKTVRLYASLGRKIFCYHSPFL